MYPKWAPRAHGTHWLMDPWPLDRDGRDRQDGWAGGTGGTGERAGRASGMGGQAGWRAGRSGNSFGVGMQINRRCNVPGALGEFPLHSWQLYLDPASTAPFCLASVSIVAVCIPSPVRMYRTLFPSYQCPLYSFPSYPYPYP